MPDPAILKILFVVNPKSGGKEKGEWESAIHEFFNELPHSIEIFLLEGQNNESSLEQLIKQFQPHRVVAVGGDGTVTMVAKLIRGTSMALGILPAGSANGMAKELNIPEDVKQALSIVVTGDTRKVDLIRINDQICLHLSDIGLNAQLIKYFEEGKLRGKLGYAKVLLKVLKNKKQLRVVICTKDQEIRRIAFMIVLANASKYGFGAVINPEGTIDDGYFEVVIIRRLALSELLKMVLKPQPFNPKKIEIFQAKSVSISTGHHAHFQVDGEYLGKVNEVKGVILPGNLLMVLPAAAIA